MSNFLDTFSNNVHKRDIDNTFYVLCPRDFAMILLKYIVGEYHKVITERPIQCHQRDKISRMDLFICRSYWLV